MGLEIENMAEDKIIRCGWCGEDSLYQKYHDEEWGKVVKDDATLFEFLILESAQAGLSWITILRKREGYRNAFANFDYHKVAEFTEEDVERILQDPGVIRNRGKINSSINNAKIFMAIQKEFGSFYNYLYSFMPNQEPIINQLETLKGAPTTTAISDAISKDLKKRGMKFFGSTTCYAYMQAVGMVNDHLLSCSFRS
ncbi:DNA-3-methyladenine glycosylase I [Sphingobacterium sp. PU5-4]|uniref:DNA-3-methyladenine glycosylase I n=1 Tax=Sphingobacterium tenebrionis TaxID=3111775 RepID=A0ABU8I3M3_9SPHI